MTEKDVQDIEQPESVTEDIEEIDETPDEISQNVKDSKERLQKPVLESSTESEDERIERITKKVFDKSLGARYIECPGCGNLILRKYSTCHACNLVFKNGRWQDAPEPAQKKHKVREDICDDLTN